jgi:hypothetical protein
LKRQILFYGFQIIAILWAGVVLLRTVTLGWGPFASMGLAVAGALRFLSLESGSIPSLKGEKKRLRLRSPRSSPNFSFVFDDSCNHDCHNNSKGDFEESVSGGDPGGMH